MTGEIEIKTEFEPIQEWADERGIYDVPFDANSFYDNINEELEEVFEAQTDEEIVGEISDIIVYCVNAIRQKGFNPDVVLEETVKKISSRTGAYSPELDKWLKDESEEAKAKWYQPDYSRARI